MCHDNYGLTLWLCSMVVAIDGHHPVVATMTVRAQRSAAATTVQTGAEAEQTIGDTETDRKDAAENES